MTATLATRRSDPPTVPSDINPRRAMWLGIGLATLATAWLTRGAWTLAPVAGGDVMFHVVRADVGIDQLLAGGRIHGWSPRMYLGTDLFLFYGPGFVWMMAIVRVLTTGLLDNGAALTAVTILSFLILPASVAFLARSLRFRPRVAGIAALLTPLVSSMFGVGFQAVFGIGLVTQQAGAVLWVLGLGCFARVLHNARRRWIVLTAVLFALHAITSPVSVSSMLVVALIAVVTIPGWPIPWAVVKRVLISGIAALGLVAFWAFPALAHRDLSGVPTYWGAIHVHELLGMIFSGRLLYPVGVGVAVAVSLLWLGRSKHFAARFLWITPLAYLGLEALAMTGPLRNMLVAPFRNHRALGLIGLILLLPLAWAIDRVWSRYDPPQLSRRGVVACCLLLGLIVAIQPERLDNPRPQDDPIPQAHQAVGVLRSSVPESGRFAYVPEGNHWGTLGVQSPNLWLAQVSGRNLLNGTGLETTRAGRGPGVAHDVAEVSAEKSSKALIELGTTHVVTVTPELARKLEDSGLFRVLWEADPLAVLEVLPSQHGDPTWGLTGHGVTSARPLKVEADNLMYMVESDRSTSVDLALAWSPHWQVRVNGAVVESSPTADWRTRVQVPAGQSVLDLRYQIDTPEYVGLALTMVTMLGLWTWVRRGILRGENAT